MGGNAAKARGAWALAQLAAKGRGDQLGQGGRLDGKAVSKPAACVSVGRGRRELPTGTGQPAAANTSRPGGAHARGVAKGGDAGVRQLAAKGRGVQHRQGDKLAGTGAMSGRNQCISEIRPFSTAIYSGQRR
jgi:hypothetical protein